MVSEAALEALRAHMAGERDRDLDATVGPLSDHPIWLMPGYRVEGRHAVRAFYERTLDNLPEGHIDECLRALDDPTVTHWGESHCVIEYSDEYPMHRGWVMVVHFDGDRVAGENCYLPSPARRLSDDQALGADFGCLPGVTRLT